MEEENDLQKQSPASPIETEKQPPADPLPDMVIRSIRTYKGDINQTVNEDKITTAKILMAEQRQREKQQVVPETSVKKPRNVIALVFGIVFLVAALGVLGYFGYTQIAGRVPSISIQPQPAFLFVFDHQNFVDVQKSRSEIYAEVDAIVADAQNSKPNTYTDIVFYKADEAAKTNVRISSAEFFTLYDVQIPTNIGRSISKDFAYGLYRTETDVEPFLVIGLADYENAYDSMFDWESTLALDMRDFFPNLSELFDINKITGLSGIQLASSTASTSGVTASSTASSTVPAFPATATSSAGVVATTSAASSTPAMAEVDFQAQLEQERAMRETINRNVQFVDVVLANKDTRAIRDANGSPFFFYAFIDKDKILFAQDPKLISEIVRKVREKQLIR